jgi:hypothetical protein
MVVLMAVGVIMPIMVVMVAHECVASLAALESVAGRRRANGATRTGGTHLFG